MTPLFIVRDRLPQRRRARVPLVVVLLLGLAAVGCGRAASNGQTQTTASATTAPATMATAKARPVRHLAAAEFAQGALLDGAPRAGVVVLDVRTPGEVANGHLPGASVINSADRRFDQKVGLMARDRPVYVYCASGGRSAAAARKLSAMGFQQVYNLTGGITGWKRAGLPVEQGADGGKPRPSLTPAAFDLAVAAQPTVLVDFETPWCAPCKRMAPRVEAAAKARGLTLLRVDIDASEALAARENVTGVPVLALYRDGKVVWRHGGELDDAALGQALRKALDVAVNKK